MGDYIMCAIDEHENSYEVAVCHNTAKATTQRFPASATGRKDMIASLRERARQAGGAQIVTTYEASFAGFALYDHLTEAEITCHVLAPTKVHTSPKGRKAKTDKTDALKLLAILRGHLLAGNALPSVWVPDGQTRDDREVLRTRMDLGNKVTGLKNQIRMLLKRHRIERPAIIRSWSGAHLRWLEGVMSERSQRHPGFCAVLASLLRQLDAVQKEAAILDERIKALSQAKRYRKAFKAVKAETGVGPLVGMTFLAELGDATRFENRRQLGAYLGVVPGCHETGDGPERKGHITHQGPARLRRALCQAVQAGLHGQFTDRAFFDRIVRRNPNKKKIAIVACMHRLGIRLWHKVRAVQLAQKAAPEKDDKGLHRSAKRSRAAAAEKARGRQSLRI